MSAATRPAYEWNTLPWRQLQRRVFKLQTRISHAAHRGDVRTVHRLQRLLTQSWSATCLAVRRVTQDNTGKKTAGVDGVKALSPRQRTALVQVLRVPTQAAPLRRVWIPKPHAPAERRPLGIPTLHDRAAQALVKLALEPEWEVQFEPHSYGFRPGRSAHDAIGALFNATHKQPKYVLDADIAKCFDRIDHDALLRKLGTTPTFRRAIRAWLKAGVLDGPDLFPTEAGTPQGGVLSPLLANIALHGLEREVTAGYTPRTRPTLIRYADDFVVLHRDLAVVEAARARIGRWLADLGLELHPGKTRISHTLDVHAGAIGFDFLGFTVRQYRRGARHTSTSGGWDPRRLGFKLLITPSKQAVHRHGRALGAIVDQHRAAPQAALIHALTPVVRGWTASYSAVCSKRTFATADHLLYLQLRRWARRRHPQKNGRWVARKYWHAGWTFSTPGPQPCRLPAHAGRAIRRHIKVQGRRSPYDGDWAYWASRMGRYPGLSSLGANLLRRQRQRCAWCGLCFTMEDRTEIDHRVPRSHGGTGTLANLQLLHGHCHDEKTARDYRRKEARAVGGFRVKDRAAEEPDEGKPSRPVLETSHPGDWMA
jgi:RNA-directed DNA polymerase